MKTKATENVVPKGAPAKVCRECVSGNAPFFAFPCRECDQGMLFVPKK